MNIILKTTFLKGKDGLQRYEVERLYSFSPNGYTLNNPYFSGPYNKYRKFEHNGYELRKYVKKNPFGEILEEVLISSKK